jgi:hypothetical protein
MAESLPYDGAVQAYKLRKRIQKFIYEVVYMMDQLKKVSLKR